MRASHKNWAAVFLIYESNEGVLLDAPPNYDIMKEIERISPSSSYHVIVLRYKAFFEEAIFRNEKTSVQELDEEGNWRSLPNAPAPEGWLYDPQKLGTLFAWIKQRHPSEARILFTSGHGSAYGIFRQNEDRALKRLLSNEILAQAIRQGFGRLQVLVMLNCLMQNIHSCFALHTCVDYFVAPEANIVDPGYDYSRIVNALGTTHYVDPKIVAMRCVESMRKHYAEWSWSWKFEQQSVFALQLSGFKRFVDVFNQKIKSLLAFLQEEGTWEMRVDIRAAVGRCVMLDLKGYQVFDLLNWAFYLNHYDFKSDTLNTLMHELYSDLYCELQPLVLARSIGKNAYTPPPYGWEITQNLRPQGLAIHLPSALLSEKKETDRCFVMEKAPYRSSFFAESPWLALFQELYKK